MRITVFSEIAPRYDAFILDLWGVIHDGQHLYPGVKETLGELHAAKKKIVFLSNAPRRAKFAVEVLTRMGIAPCSYEGVVTSGETAYNALAHPDASFFAPGGKQYFYIGSDKDRDILEGLDYKEAQQPDSAQFVLLTHTFYDNQPLSELAELLRRCKALDLPMLCVNPDTEVVRQNGERIFCAGLVAAEYEKLGGKVVYFGKPHRAAYEACLKIVNVKKPRILAVGDNLATDIKGAQDMGIAAAFVTGGILNEILGDPDSKDYEMKCRELFEAESIAPDFVIPAFCG